MTRRVVRLFAAVELVTVIASGAAADSRRFPVRRCMPDAVLAGSVCLDTYEASVWRVPNPTTINAGLVRRIQLGQATRVDLTVGGALQLGTAGDDYAPCTDLHCFPERAACADGRVVRLALHDILLEVLRRGDPLLAWQEEGRPQDDAADEIVLSRVTRSRPVASKASPHLGQ